MQILLDKCELESMILSIVQVRGFWSLNYYLPETHMDLRNVMYRDFVITAKDIVVKDESVMRAEVRFTRKKRDFWLFRPERRLFKEIKEILDRHYGKQSLRKDGGTTYCFMPFWYPGPVDKEMGLFVELKWNSDKVYSLYCECEVSNAPAYLGMKNEIKNPFIVIYFHRIPEETLVKSEVVS